MAAAWEQIAAFTSSIRGMKHTPQIKTLIRFGAFILAAAWASPVSAFTYTNGDLLLVFRKDTFNDVEFNLGTVSNYLGKVDGTVMQVTNWNVNLVRANFNNSLVNVKFLLASVTASDDALRRAWLTDANAADSPTDITGSRLTQIYSKVDQVGANAAAATATNSSQAYVTNSSDATSFSFIASGGGSLDASTLGGASPFPIEIELPVTNRFVELRASSVTPKPAAHIIGTFAMTSAGALTFTAGPPSAALTASHIQSIGRAGNVNSITFSTVSGVNYRLRYASTLGAAWTILPGSAPGSGGNQTLTDTTADAQRFYVVESYH